MGSRTDQTFFQRENTDGQQTHEKMLSIIREMQIKTTPLRIAITKRTKITNFGEDKGRVKGALLQSWWEYKLVQPLWKTIWYGCFSKTKNWIVIWSSIWSRFKSGKEVHQGCISSPYLFNLHAGFIMQNAGLDEAQFSSVQSPSRVLLFATPWTAARQASLSITNSWSLLKFMSFELVMPSNHLILCRSILLLPSIFPSVRVFSKESIIRIRRPKCWNFCTNSALRWNASTGMKHKLVSRLPGEISTTSDMQMTPPLWQKVKRKWRASWWKWKWRVKKLA